MAAILVAVVLQAGCYHWKYAKIVRTHVEVLGAMAAKIEDVTAREGGARPEEFAEFRYPLARARDFARIVKGRFVGRESYSRFVGFVERYAGILAAAERLRADGTGPESARAELSQSIRALREDAARVIAALDEEE